MCNTNLKQILTFYFGKMKKFPLHQWNIVCGIQSLWTDLLESIKLHTRKNIMQLYHFIAKSIVQFLPVLLRWTRHLLSFWPFTLENACCPQWLINAWSIDMMKYDGMLNTEYEHWCTYITYVIKRYYYCKIFTVYSKNIEKT